jgi:hypothetical protein
VFSRETIKGKKYKNAKSEKAKMQAGDISGQVTRGEFSASLRYSSLTCLGGKSDEQIRPKSFSRGRLQDDRH